MEELMDLMVTDESPSAISDKLKELLYAKTAERVDSMRPFAASSLFDENEEDEDDYEDDDEVIDKNDEEVQDEDLLKLNEFIEKAIEFGANALDLSKKNLKKLPKKLFQLSNIQVLNLFIYLNFKFIKSLSKIIFKVYLFEW